MDELAIVCGLDPIDLRIRNEPDIDPESGLPFSSRNLVTCCKRACADSAGPGATPPPRPARGGLAGRHCAGAAPAGSVRHRPDHQPQDRPFTAAGGMTMGLSMALHEHSVPDPRFGHVVNQDFAEYHIAANADVGTIEVALLDEDDPYVNPMGSKGIGELGIVGTAAAVANSVFHATGTRVRTYRSLSTSCCGRSAEQIGPLWVRQRISTLGDSRGPTSLRCPGGCHYSITVSDLDRDVSAMAGRVRWN